MSASQEQMKGRWAGHQLGLSPPSLCQVFYAELRGRGEAGSPGEASGSSQPLPEQEA